MTAPQRRNAAAARRLRIDARQAAPELPAELDQLVSKFQPSPALAAHWSTIRPAVTDIMARSQIRGLDSFRKHLTHVGYFLRWVQLQDLPVAAETLTRVRTDEYTRIGMPNSSAKSRADRRSRLRWLADQVNPDQALDNGVRTARPTLKPPYSEAELLQMTRVAITQPTEERIRKAALCLALGAGAGLDSSDLRHLRRHHITDTADHGMVVNIPAPNARSVPVRHRFEPLLRRGLTDIAEDHLVLGRVEDRRNIAANALADIIILGDCPRIEQSRLRVTWLAHLLREPVPLDVLLAAAGLRSARTLPDLFPYLPTLPHARTDRALRGDPVTA